MKHKKVVALIPCYNEAEGIASVLQSFPREKMRMHGYDLHVIVINNNSTDKTEEIALANGATVLNEPMKGKGNAMRLGFNSIPSDADYVVMLDGDNTYRPEEILRLLELLDSNFCDVVIGSRLGGRIHDGSMTTFNKVGNWVFSHLVRYFYRVNVTDVLTGYFAWKRESLERLRPHLVSEGFAIEMEMVTKMAKLGEEIYSVPISYIHREGESSLSPVWDGLRILWMFTKNLLWSPIAEKVQHIVFVSDTVLPYMKGGKEKRLYEISRRLVREGREVHIYTMKWWDGPNTISHEGVQYHAISKLYPLYINGRRSMSEAIMFALSIFKLLFVKFDVLDVDHMPFFPLFSARIVTWLRGKKLYATWHEVWGTEYWREYLKGPSGYIGSLIEWMSFKLPDVIIANSYHTAKKLEDSHVRSEIKIVPLGADLESIYAAPLGTKKSDVIYVGRLLDHKGVDLLVSATAFVKERYPKIKINIIGTGPEKENLIDLISKLDLQENVELLGDIKEHSTLYGLMKASKMLVLPSIREGFGLVVVEAHAAGIPVITTRHKDNAAGDLVREGVNGFLADPTAEDIAAKIETLMATYKEMEPRKGIEKYDWHAVVKKIEKAFA